MKAKELIAYLQEQVKTIGDVEVVCNCEKIKSVDMNYAEDSDYIPFYIINITTTK